MTDDDRREVFDGVYPADHEAEAEERWGDTGAYRESARRVRKYSEDDWARFKAESDAVNEAVATLLDDGVPPDDPRAMDTAERHRLLVDRWFFPCPHLLHAQLGRMYVTDARFTATYEKVRAGMAQYLCDAIAANAARASGYAAPPGR